MVTSWDRRLLVELHQLVNVLGLHLEVDVHNLHRCRPFLLECIEEELSNQ